MQFAIVTDSTCDLPSSIVAERGITITPQHILWGTESLVDGVDITTDAFYKRLAHDSVLPKTSQPSAADFADRYRKARETHGADSVLCITLSKPLSGTYSSAVAARDMVDFPVMVVDSTTVSISLGFTVLVAADARDRGASIEEAASIAAAAGKRSKLMFTLATLDFLHRGGRIGGARRFVGTALNIKPILHIKDGEVTALESVRTHKKALSRMVEIAAQQSGSRPLWVGALNTNSGDFDELAQELQDKLKPDLFVKTTACTAIGVHTGPGTVGVGLMYASS
jgi:DegV family protein with EDD domain